MRDQWEVNVVLKTVLCVHSEVIFFFSDNAVVLLLCFSYCLETFFFFLEFCMVCVFGRGTYWTVGFTEVTHIRAVK